MKIPPESLRRGPQLSDAEEGEQPSGYETSHANTRSASKAESLLAAKKRALEMMANGATLAEVLNDLCTAIGTHAPLLLRWFV